MRPTRSSACCPTREGPRWPSSSPSSTTSRSPTEERPHLALNFATTLDGRAAIDGRSGAIGSEVDTEVLQRLRTRVDAVMIGAGTMRAERYGRIVSDPALRAYRERTLLSHDPLAVIVSNGLDIPWDAGYCSPTAAATSSSSPVAGEQPPETATPVTVIRHPGQVNLAGALALAAGGARHLLGAVRGRSHPPR